MTRLRNSFKLIFMALMLNAATAVLCNAQATVTDALDALYNDLSVADETSVPKLELEIVNEWSKSGSPTLDLLLRRGHDAIEAGENTLAIEHLTAAVDHDPAFAHAFNMRAIAYFNLGLFGPAMSDIRQTLARDHRHFGALGGFAMILMEIGEDEQALEVYRKILDIHPLHNGANEAVEYLEAQLNGRTL